VHMQRKMRAIKMVYAGIDEISRCDPELQYLFEVTQAGEENRTAYYSPRVRAQGSLQHLHDP
jgi:hypothetical protein